jgi:hypothetical protein
MNNPISNAKKYPGLFIFEMPYMKIYETQAMSPLFFISLNGVVLPLTLFWKKCAIERRTGINSNDADLY